MAPPERRAQRGSDLVPLLAACGFLWVAGCASVDNITRAQPGAHIAKGIGGLASTNFNSAFDGLVVFRSVDEDGKVKDAVGLDSVQPVVFISADVSQLLRFSETLGLAGKAGTAPDDATLTNRRNRIIELLLYLSDHNATVYLNRLFAINRFRKGGIQIVRDLTAAASTGTILLYPPVATGLGALSLYGGMVSDQIDATYYNHETIETLQLGIQLARSRKRDEILGKFHQGYANYGIASALGDVLEYDSLTSFRRGLQELQGTAAREMAAKGTNRPPASATQ